MTKVNFILKGIIGLAVICFLTGCSAQEKITLVENSKCYYSIYIDPSAPESVVNAADDLKSYFTKVTGASPEIVSTAQPPLTPFISLGNTSAAKAAGFDATVIPMDGFRMVTRDGNFFIFGPDTPTGEVNSLGGVNNGTSNGVYTFIEDYLGVLWLMPGDLGEEYDKVKSISIPAVDRTESSPFDYRDVSFRSGGPLEDEWGRHMKLWKVVNVTANHSWVQTIPPSFYEEHPGYFANVGGKSIVPSGTYYKLETTNPALVQAFADVIIETFRKNPDKKWYSLSASDGGNWSDSPASRALTEIDPEGEKSYTPLVLKFFNDVAKIVGKEFPDHKLGGYMYNDHRYPPAAGLPKLEPNLVLMLVGHTQHWRLYRPNHPEVNDYLMKTWGESRKDGVDLYYYSYPLSLMMPNAMIVPPTPDHLNFIYSKMKKYGFKGGEIYASGPVWPVFGAGNYMIAKMFWNPELDAHELLKDYCEKAYGRDAGPYIVNLYNVLDSAYNKFYVKYPKAGSGLTANHLKEIYAVHYQELEDNFLKARATEKNDKQNERLEMFGEVLSLMQWHLREHKLISPDYKTPMTLTTDEIDMLLSKQHKDFQIVRGPRMRSGALKVEKASALPDAARQKASNVPMQRIVQMLMNVATTGEVTINVKAYDGNNEFVMYNIIDMEGKQVLAGAISEGRTISFKGEAGKNYFFNIGSRGARIKLEVEGASIAYKSYGGFELDGGYMDGDLPLYFYVPKGTKNFSITLASPGAKMDIFSPDGRKIDQFVGKSRKIIPVNETGFWKIVLYKTVRSPFFELDGHLPQWIIPDPANPLIVTPI